jgi:hypothetical protein
MAGVASARRYASTVARRSSTMPAAAFRNNALAGHAAMTSQVMAALPSLA